MKQYRENEKYYSTEHLVYRCSYHVVFCPKYRHKILTGEVSKRLKEVCIEVSKEYDFLIEDIETDKDHIHMIITCNPRFGICKCVSLIKQITAYKLFKEFPQIKKTKLWGGRFWSRSSFIGTVGSVSLEVVKKYIENQGR